VGVVLSGPGLLLSANALVWLVAEVWLATAYTAVSPAATAAMARAPTATFLAIFPAMFDIGDPFHGNRLSQRAVPQAFSPVAGLLLSDITDALGARSRAIPLAVPRIPPHPATARADMNARRGADIPF
jgi:hypothetical protein